MRQAHSTPGPVQRATHGVLLYQESVLAVGIALAGFSAGEADALRRAMGPKRSAGRLAALEGRFLAGAAARGVPGATARAVLTRSPPSAATAS